MLLKLRTAVKVNVLHFFCMKWLFLQGLQCTAQWLATVLGQHFLFTAHLGIYLICLYSLKSFVEFKFCAKKAISGIYGLENSQKFLKKAKNF